MSKYTSSLAIAVAATAISATAAFAVSTSPFSTPLSPGDSTLGSATASAFENFGMTTLLFTAADDLLASYTAIIDPFFTDLVGAPLTSISLAYSVNGGATSAISITPLTTPAVGAAGGNVLLGAGDTLSFFISGQAGQSGNTVSFGIETSDVPVPSVPVLPAGYLAVTGLAALGATRLRKKK